MTEIKIFADYMCPFCYIGFSIINKLRKENSNIKFIWKPSVLNYDLPKEGVLLETQVDKKQIDKGYQRITMLGSEYNLIYNNRTRNFNTNRLHKAALFARDNNKFYEFSESAFKFIFEDGLNVGINKNIDSIAESVGLNVIKMNSDIDNGIYDSEFEESIKEFEENDFDSVPTFVVNNKKIVTNLKKYDEFKKDLLE